jgi:cysteine desulfurase
VALGRAAELAAAEQVELAERLRMLRDELAARLKGLVPDLVVNAEESPRAPHLLSVSIDGADSEALVMHLDLAGIAASSGSACSTGAVEPSHVLVAMGVPRERALGAIRFSFGRESTHADVERAAAVVPAVVAKVRKLASVLGRTGAPSETTVRPPDRQTVR